MEDRHSQLIAPHGRLDSRSSETKFTFEGPWNINDPVHELITERALKAAGMIEPQDPFSSAAAWEFVRGVIWSDDPEGLLFDNNESETHNWSSGIEFLRRFNDYKAGARGGAFYAQGSPLLARSHFGDLQCLHAMAAQDGEPPLDTRKNILEWAEFLYGVAIGNIPEDRPISDIKVSRKNQWFPGVDQTVRGLFLIGQIGDTRKRSLGALLHLIEDSFAPGHVDRRDDWSIAEFHAYVGQDDDTHGQDDLLAPGGLDSMPNALRAVEICTCVLKFWKRDDHFSALRPYLEQTVLLLAPGARAAGPGDKYAR